MKKSPVNNNLRAPFWLRITSKKINRHLSASAAGTAFALIIISALVALPIDLLVAKNEVILNPLPQEINRPTQVDSTLKQLIEVRKLQGIGTEEELPLPKIEKLATLTTASLTSKLPDFSESSSIPFSFVYPVMGPRKSSGYGMRVHPIRGFSTKHKGIDLAAPVGASIRAMAKGKVIFADPYAGYGKLIVLDHGNGITTHYAHCDKLVVRIGESVETGQIIAEVGSTGMSTGPHLHLEVRINGQPANPEKYFVGLADKGEG